MRVISLANHNAGKEPLAMASVTLYSHSPTYWALRFIVPAQAIQPDATISGRDAIQGQLKGQLTAIANLMRHKAWALK